MASGTGNMARTIPGRSSSWNVRRKWAVFSIARENNDEYKGDLPSA